MTPVTTTRTPRRTLGRIGSRAAALTVVPMLVLLAGPAHADIGVGWSDPEPVDPMHALLLLAGVPLLLFVLIAIAVYAPALARGERVAPGAHVAEEHWIGGPRQGSAELESGAHGGEPGETGGARGSW